jgi:hypothetical protein
MDIQWWSLQLHHKIERKKLWPEEHIIEGCLNAFYFHILIIAKFEYDDLMNDDHSDYITE